MKALFQRISLSDRNKIVAPSPPITMSAFDPKRTWLTVRLASFSVVLLVGTMKRPTLGGDNEATRFHQGLCWLSSRLAARGAGATATDAGDRTPHRSGVRRRPRTPGCVPSRSERFRLCRGP